MPRVTPHGDLGIRDNIDVLQVGMSLRKYVSSLLWGSSVLLIVACQMYVPESHRGIVQLCVVPIFLCLIIPFFASKSRVLSVSLLVAGATGVALAAKTYFMPSCTFCVPLGPNDPLGGGASLLVERIASKAVNPQSFGLIMARVGSEKEARVGLGRYPSAKVFLWGENDINLSFRAEGPVNLDSANFSVLQSLRVVQQVPSIRISIDAGGHTFYYLGRVLSTDELDLRGAGRLRAPWKEGAHLSYAYWKLGSKLLSSSVAGRVNWGELECAEAILGRALSQLRSAENEHLVLAVANNLAVTRFALGYLGARPVVIRKAFKAFRRLEALEKRIKPNREFLGSAVAENLTTIRNYMIAQGISLRGRVGKKRKGNDRKSQLLQRGRKARAHQVGPEKRPKKDGALGTRKKNRRQS